MVRRLVVEAPAKINLHLSIGSLGPDGYHALSGVFHTIDLCDTLTVEAAEGFSFCCDAQLGIASSENIARDAALLMSETFLRPLDVGIELVKRIPHGAGLGGGSSDAAATIVALSRLWGIEASDPRCLDVARSLGADVPFFLVGGAALMGGRGDVLVRSLPPLGTPIALIKPAGCVSTAHAYRCFDANPAATANADAMCAALDSGDANSVADALFNNMEPAARALVPEIGEILVRATTAPGVLGVRMSGSGSAVFAICENESVARELAASESSRGLWATASALRESGIRVIEEELL